MTQVDGIASVVIWWSENKRQFSEEERMARVARVARVDGRCRWEAEVEADLLVIILVLMI